MPVSKKGKEFVSYVVDLMSSIGPVQAKSIFGGHGIYLEGLMFALVADSVLYLKSDEETENDFKVKGLLAFTYNKNGKEYKMSYYQASGRSARRRRRNECMGEQSVWCSIKSCSEKS